MDKAKEKLFVYGTLLQGEPRSRYLEDCKLIQSMEIPGELYDTGRGYPAGLFDKDSEETVRGELYAICEDVDKKLKELDEIEGTETGLYKRKKLRHKNHSFYIYEAGESLRDCLQAKNKITSGNWRRHTSVALEDPVEFALNFENSQKKRYKELPPEDSGGLVFLRGEIPVLITAPHATEHFRMNASKYQEKYTGALSSVLHILTGSHALYTHWASSVDPNFYEDAPFKKNLEKVVKKFGIEFVIDLHGTRREWDEDIYPGIGVDREFLLGDDSLFYKLRESAESNNLILGGLDVFPASRQMTVTKFVSRNLGIPAMQIEINERLRHPETDPLLFKRLVKFLSEFIRKSSESLIGAD